MTPHRIALPRRRLTLLILMLLLPLGCAPGNSEHTANPCGALPLITYSRAQQATLAQEIDQSKDEGVFWPQMVIDYGRLRAMVRACKGTS